MEMCLSSTDVLPSCYYVTDHTNTPCRNPKYYTDHWFLYLIEIKAKLFLHPIYINFHHRFSVNILMNTFCMCLI